MLAWILALLLLLAAWPWALLQLRFHAASAERQGAIAPDNAEAIGPILLGMDSPVHVLHAGNDVEDFVAIATIATTDANARERQGSSNHTNAVRHAL